MAYLPTYRSGRTENTVGPRQRGFDRYFGIITGAANYWKPNTLTRDNDHIPHDEIPEGFFSDRCYQR